jgi:DNA integrity scanning protein DisA with diadenylate cyclase activity
MNELYWLTRLEYIQNFLVIVMSASGIAMFVSFMLWTMAEYTEEIRKTLSWLRWAFATLVISSLIFVFVPSTKEAVLIWGVGSTIDYLQENETAKQLPDKCINALNDWVESLSDEKHRWSDGQTEGEQ